jgi:hypothetical protein
VPLLRALLPIIATFALLGASATAWAAAGLTGSRACCCPVPATCKCADHRQRPRTTATIDECREPVKLVAPSVPVATAPAVVVLPAVHRAALPLDILLAPMPEPRFVQPETPPF